MLDHPTHDSMVDRQSISHVSFQRAFESAHLIFKLFNGTLSGSVGCRLANSRMLWRGVGDITGLSAVAKGCLNGSNDGGFLVRSIRNLGNTFILQERLKAIQDIKVQRTLGVANSCEECLARGHPANENG